MLQKLDHITLLSSNFEEAVQNYEIILGYPAVWHSTQTAQGSSRALFKVGEIALQIVSPQHNDSVKSEDGDGRETSSNYISSISLASDNIEETHRILKRRELEPTEITAYDNFDQERREFTCRNAKIKNVEVKVVEPLSGFDESPKRLNGEIPSLDHLVIDTPNVERAAATYGARMGFRLALERHAPEWKVHFLFFRIGEITFEVVHRLGVNHDINSLDRTFGFSWATKDLESTHQRLVSRGRDVSEIRVGRRPGSRVFTLRDKTCDIPTIFIEHENRVSVNKSQ